MDWLVFDSSFLLAAATAASEPTTLSWLLSTVQSLFYVAIGLGFVIFVHELGHFLVAKACGVKCEKFYVGFDFLEIPIPFTPWKIPRSLWKMQIGETEYGIGSLPLGGYVKMLGQDDDPRNAETEAERTKAIASGTAAEGLVSGTSVEQSTAEGLTLGSTIEKIGEKALHVPPTHSAAAADVPPPNAVAVKNAEGKTIYLDPRSYTAKSVPARMAIISAGVIMNAIFAVVFATIAYKMGVLEMPAGVGGSVPGDPAWQAGLEPGSKIIAFGKDSKPYEHLRWEDLMRNIVLNGKKADLAIQVREASGKETWYDVKPVKHEGNKFPTVGVTPLRSSELYVASEAEQKKGQKLGVSVTSIPLKTDDKIVAVNGQKVTSGAQIAALLVQNPQGKLTLTVERTPELPPGTDPKAKKPDPEVLEVTVEASPVRELGVVLGLGPIASVRKGSPAETAGFQVGDQIETIGGEPAGDPLSLGQRLLDRVGQQVTVVVNRAGQDNKREQKELTATLEQPLNLFPLSSYVNSGFAAAETLGIAFELVPVVAEVPADGPAAKQDIKPGDKLISASFVLPEVGQPSEEDKTLSKLKIDLEKTPNQWLKLLAQVQSAKAEYPVRLEFMRGDKLSSVDIVPAASKTHFDEARGLWLQNDSGIHIADNWSEAFSLGLRETKERIQEVLLVLHRLVTFQLSPTNLSGPPGILRAATTVASHGIPAMLLFLTMLSANLAVINFLPIPVLDGGHMVFLAAEWVRGKPVDAELQYKLTLAGLFFLLSLMVFASAMDVGRFLYG
ncbi:site-2 protease family protein [Anatilimnocola sp. NA78]|uniref:site-2 protease family protein n=1 Tax=Anatilimnocola sp. NA78 TaxID=3415683 RepID=UPI003CE470E9